ncbi:hypothetical protein C491_01252 [Natronococcus amylolyticus DSM 10524]|uniref:Uncharacterized protein n=1 Tax=Natronococcus amylolyticus DSM 10524 TaxID=1227497 RepID=L9XIJ9_9EURY|nr:hypothetical protein [Natronococcus amylolyticus]ELY61442.1 hypothetical protein C491_01252 [Natronococcus amylolyticus DSM 10524]
MSIDRDRLERRLREEFGGSSGAARVVARQATDLADSGRYEADTRIRLTTEIVLEELEDAPDGGPPERWNWWIGSLEIAFGGYETFGICRYQE